MTDGSIFDYYIITIQLKARYQISNRLFPVIFTLIHTFGQNVYVRIYMVEMSREPSKQEP